MNRLQKALGIGALTLALATGCEQKKPEKPEYVTGTVIQERGTVVQLVESSGALFGNESVKISGQAYILQIQTPQGVYTASIIKGQKPLEALALVIEERSRVRIEKKYFDEKRYFHTNFRFGEDKIGYLYSDEITVESKE